MRRIVFLRIILCGFAGLVLALQDPEMQQKVAADQVLEHPQRPRRQVDVRISPRERDIGGVEAERPEADGARG